MQSYKHDHPVDKRSAEAARIREKCVQPRYLAVQCNPKLHLGRYPDRIPVICEKDPRSDIPPVDKRKYLIPMDLTVGQFVYVIRKRISIPSDKAIFIFVNNTLPPTAALMSTMYEQHRDEDGFMYRLELCKDRDGFTDGHPRLDRYMMYSGENTFGAAVCVHGLMP